VPLYFPEKIHFREMLDIERHGQKLVSQEHIDDREVDEHLEI
jgi:hypothetical protein